MKAQGAAIQGGLAAVALIAAYTTWQREPERKSGEVAIIDASASDVQKIRYEDSSGPTVKWVELERRKEADGPRVWLRVAARPDQKAPERELRGNESANKLFGTTHVVGRPMAVTTTAGEPGQAQTQTITLTVMAVIPSPSLNSTLIYDAIAGFNAPAAKAYVDRYSMWSWGNGHLYARLQPGATAGQVGALADAMLQKQPLPPGLPADFLKGGGGFATQLFNRTGE